MDYHDDDWSDEEGDYCIRDEQGNPPSNPSTSELVNERDIAQKSKTFRAYNSDLNLHPIIGLLERERKQQEPPARSFRVPLPYVSYHTKETLGEELVKDLWEHFLEHEADESEMILYSDLKQIFDLLRKNKIELPYDDIKFELDDDEYIEFKQVLDELVSKLNVPGCRPSNNNTYKRKPTVCCGRIGCRSLNNCSHLAPPEYPKYFQNFHRLQVIYTRYSSEMNGKVRIKYLTDIMDEAEIPYDQSRKPYEYWYINSESYIHDMEELIELVNDIRTDKDIEIENSENDKDIPIEHLNIPLWLKKEFSKNEIIMYKYRFYMFTSKIPAKDSRYTIDVLNIQNLKDLFESLGQKISISDIENFIIEHDLLSKGGINFEEFLTLIFKVQHGNTSMDSFILEQVVLEAKSQQKVFEEIETLNNSPIDGVRIVRYGGCPVICELVLSGPSNSLYENGEFRFDITFDSAYPFILPTCVFKTRILSINIFTQLTGHAILPHLTAIWTSTWNIRTLINHIIHILIHPEIKLIPSNISELLHVININEIKLLDDAVDENDSTTHEIENENEEEKAYRAEYVKLSLKNLNKMELIHFNFCRQFLFERHVFDQNVKDMVDKFAKSTTTTIRSNIRK
eukprot:gene10658-22247_t